jgi:hypothetical protein
MLLSFLSGQSGSDQASPHPALQQGDEQDEEDERNFRDFARSRVNTVLRNIKGLGDKILNDIGSSSFKIDREEAVQTYLEKHDPKIANDIGRLVLIRAGEQYVYIGGELMPATKEGVLNIKKTRVSELGVISRINSDSTYNIHSLEGCGSALADHRSDSSDSE